MHTEQNWARMPKHLLDSILEKLVSSVDYLQFGTVCGLWNTVAKENQNKQIKRSFNHDHVPMLLISNTEKEYSWKVYNAIENRFVEPEIVVPYGKRLSSSGGWLIAVNSDFTVTLYKPFSMADAKATIHLPCLFPPDEDDPEIYMEYVEDCYNHVSKATMTADPVANPDDCILVVLYGSYREMALIRPAKDTAWTKIVVDATTMPWDMMCQKNDMYVLQQGGELHYCDISDPCNLKIKLIASKISVPNYFVFSKRYLVKSRRGELLQVLRYLNWPDDGDRLRVTRQVRVYKLELKGSRWVDIEDLGDDNALFLGDNSSICVAASNFVGCQPNCIYFTHDYDTVGIGGVGPVDIGVYHLKDRSLTLGYNMDSETIAKMRARPPIWVVPTLNFH